MIGGSQLSQPLEDQHRVDCRQHRFEYGGLQQTGCLPVLNFNLAGGAWRRPLTRDRHDDQIGALAMVGRAADHGSRWALCRGLIGKGGTKTMSPNS